MSFDAELVGCPELDKKIYAHLRIVLCFNSNSAPTVQQNGHTLMYESF